jgi:hypothetical protein
MGKDAIGLAVVAGDLAREGERLQRSPASSVEINVRGQWQESQEIYAETLISGPARCGEHVNSIRSN